MKKILSSLLTIAIIIALFTGCKTDKNNYKTENNNMVSQDNSDIKEEKNNNDTTEKSSNVEKNENTNGADFSFINDVKENVTEQKIVVIDPGHGKNGNKGMEAVSPDSNELKIKDPGGAQGIKTNIPEYKITLQVALKLKKLLEANNIKVVMTKTEESESPGNIERAEIANNINANLEIRIHCDSAENQSAHGASMLVPDSIGYAANISSISRTYGETILESLVGEAGMYNRGISVRSDLTGFNWSKVPIVLVEMGFMSNPEEDALLSDDSYQNKLAQGLSKGILKALE